MSRSYTLTVSVIVDCAGECSTHNFVIRNFLLLARDMTKPGQNAIPETRAKHCMRAQIRYSSLSNALRNLLQLPCLCNFDLHTFITILSDRLTRRYCGLSDLKARYVLVQAKIYTG